MKNLLLLICFLVLNLVSFAQSKPQWPRNEATGRVEFRGQLLWPDSAQTESQRQLLVRRWYRSKLTNDKVEEIRKLIKLNGTVYGGVPKESCYKFSTLDVDVEYTNFCFHLGFTPDDKGLTYRLFDFECGYFCVDVGGIYTLEEVSKSDDPRVQYIMNGFRKRLTLALQGW